MYLSSRLGTEFSVCTVEAHSNFPQRLSKLVHHKTLSVRAGRKDSILSSYTLRITGKIVYKCSHSSEYFFEILGSELRAGFHRNQSGAPLYVIPSNSLLTTTANETIPPYTVASTDIP